MPKDVNIKKNIGKLQKKLEGLLDITESIPVKPSTEVIIYNKQEVEVPEKSKTPDFEEDFNVDYAKTRQTLLELLKNTDRMIQGIMSFAEEGESARVYEVSGMLMKTRADISMQLMELQEKVIVMKSKSNLSGNGGFTPTTNNINNAVIFSGTTQDVLDQIEKSKKS